MGDRPIHPEGATLAAPQGTDDQQQSKWWTLQRNLGLIRDGIGAATPAVEAGFGIAERSVDFGFAAARAGASAPFRVASWALGGTSEGADAAAYPINAAIDAAHAITWASLRFSRGVTDASLRASDAGAGLLGGEKGESLRALRERVESQRGEDGHEVREAVLGICELLVELGGRLEVRDPLLLLRGARHLALLHEARRAGRIAERLRRSGGGAGGGATDGGDPVVVVPHGPELDQLRHFMRFSAAAYGDRASQFLGIVPVAATSIDDRGVICALTGVTDGDILLAEVSGGGDMYRPAHFVAVDRKKRQVIVAIRGTMSKEDVLVDLVCESDEIVTVWDGDEMLVGRAHRGFLRSAQRLAGELHQIVAEALRANEGFELVITGHSLGGGTATILALLWARVPEFRARNIRAFAFAAPCSVCADISQAPFTRRHVTSIITGDDVVSRLGLATFVELQRNMVALARLDGGDISMERRAQVLSDLQPYDGEGGKLFCGGRVWWLNSAEYRPHPIVEIDPVQELQSIELFGDIFAVHLPNSYINTLESLDEQSL